MRIDPIVANTGNDQNLKFVVDQLNRKIQQINQNQSDLESSITTLSADAFDYTKILVNTDGDVLTNTAGEVLLGSN